MKREELSQKIKENLNCAKEGITELPSTLREVGGERFAQVILILLTLCGLTISFCLGQIAYRDKTEGGLVAPPCPLQVMGRRR